MPSLQGTTRMRVLLDTQVLVMAYLGEVFSPKVHALLADPDTERIVSTASIMEIAIKNANQKLTMSEAHTEQAVVDLRLKIIPFAARHAYRLFSLPMHHRDPFDRMLIATALSEGIGIIGVDRHFKSYKGLRVIW